MRDLIWASMLTAQMNVCYWSKLAYRYTEREKWIKIFLAITSSGTVAGWVVWTAYPIAWKALSGLSAITAIVLPILNYSGRAAQMDKAASKSAQLRLGYDQLWAQLDSLTPDSLKEMLAQLNKKEIELSELQVSDPDDRTLLARCQDDVLQSRGLPRN